MSPLRQEAAGVEARRSLAHRDLRRRFAELALRGGSPPDQISLNLSHTSL
jgi:hypothetical protein